MGYTGGTLAIAAARRLPILVAAFLVAVVAALAFAMAIDGSSTSAAPVPSDPPPGAPGFTSPLAPAPAISTAVAEASTPDPTPTPGPAPTSTPYPSPGDAPTAGLTLWAGGDSMSVWMNRALESLAPEWGMVPVFTCDDGSLSATDQSCMAATGLVSTEHRDWPETLAGVIESDAPDVLVFMVGANDAQYFQGISFGERGWAEAYAGRVGEVMDSIRDPDRLVVWVGQPNARYDTDQEFDAKMRTMNRIYEAEAAERPGVMFVDTYELFGGDEFAPFEALRHPDGLHFSYAGGEYLARSVLHAIVDALEARGP